MAREYGRYLTKTHRDPLWTSLTTTHHDCYMALLSSEDISWAGVVPYAPARFAGLASDLTEKKVEKVWADLAKHRLIVVDRAAGEILIRTFVRHDNVLSKPNLTKALLAARGRIRSKAIRAAMDEEMRRILAEPKRPAGCRAFREVDPDLYDELTGDGLVP